MASMPMPRPKTRRAAAATREHMFTVVERSVTFRSPIPLKYPCTPLVMAGSRYINAIRCRYRVPMVSTAGSLVNSCIMGPASR